MTSTGTGPPKRDTYRHGDLRHALLAAGTELARGGGPGAVVVICTELPSNPGMSVTNAVRRVAAEVIEAHLLPTPLVWIEHHPPETMDGRTEFFEMVLFDSYEVREARSSYLGDRALEIGSPSWKALDRSAVERVVGEELR